MKPEEAGPANKTRSPWWPLNLRWVRVALIVGVLLYAVNYVVASLYPGAQ
jgi:hypothetical protein